MCPPLDIVIQLYHNSSKSVSTHKKVRTYLKGEYDENTREREACRHPAVCLRHLVDLWKQDTLRYSELKRSLGNVTYKMLSSQLKELEADGLVLRREYPQVPPKVEYSLTEKGKSMMPILSELCRWGNQNVPDGWEQN